ncbi:prophage antirepressor [Clostridium phage phiCP13O]|uniref:antirepressor n=1 Tax=Clostridium phage phiCP39-O TaxID=541865 RepID=UPI000181BCF7|nr:antirepressor [Clostridium phage phiCP39-O]YP_007004005.1 prophage antirepressor [Clostridium phage phiCP26F]YP_007005040.1 prophage antirepressor [Clostridium phage phiCP13O]AEI74552.1 prophage antirepressor [Clostridium phage phiCP9O]ACE82005.1 antirepressor [Clostridium phage phiCP39-O]AEA86243.1 prophage antirepressor [Clostridium phage phiCP26F]AEI74451.1 prophage antirepressor [Clostridium phage phiCP13O]
MFNLLEKYNVRIIQTEEEIWFSAEDLGELLEIKNIRDAVRKIEEEDKMKFNNSNVEETYIRNFESKLPNRGTTFLTEQGVYQIAFRSNKIEAQQFTKWVSKVVKEIRRNGYYILEEQEKQRWFATRKETKEVRKQETDMIKTLVEYAREQGSEHPEKYYISYTNLANKTLGIKANERDKLNQSDLLKLRSFETLITIKIEQGIKEGLHYKEIYKKVKNFMEMI